MAARQRTADHRRDAREQAHPSPHAQEHHQRQRAGRGGVSLAAIARCLQNNLTCCRDFRVWENLLQDGRRLVLNEVMIMIAAALSAFLAVRRRG